MADTKQTQRQQILHRLERGASITPIQALNLYGCFRLGGRIHELRCEGWPIVTEMVKVKTRDGRSATIASYRIAK